MKNGILYLGLMIIGATTFHSCQQEVTGDTANYEVKLSFQHKVGNDALQFATTYTNAQLEPYTVTNFKYYISNISFTNEAGVETKVPESYFLVDEKAPASKSFTVSVAANRFSKINFYVGVDSSRNVSGVQTGALDPANGMFWTWNSGYIMAKLEGTSPASTAPLQGLTYHIGGFKSDNNVVKKITLDLPTALNISKLKASEVLITADVNAWFTGVADVKIADDAFCMSPGELANKIAANYMRMFTVTDVIN